MSISIFKTYHRRHISSLQLILLFFLLVCFSSKAQYIEVDDSYTAQQLVEDVFIGSENDDCVQVSNVVISGYTFEDGHLSYGYFSRGSSNFAIEEGVLLTTGKAVSAVGPNDSLLSEGPSGNVWGGDQDLEQAINLNNTVNATILEFDFIANFSQVSFDYIFSSEQYLTSINSPNQCNYTDGFAFLIKRANVNEPYTNLAVIPDTNIPVTVNTVRGEGVCPSANEEYFDSFNDYQHPTNYNGQTVVMTAQTEIIAGETYHIKLVIADQGNNLYDSAVFLRGGSFGNARKDLGTDRLIATGNPLCEGQTLTIDATTTNAVSYQWYKDDAIILGAENPVYDIVEQGDYEVHIDFSDWSCVMKGDITVEFSSNPIVYNTTLVQCDNSAEDIVFNLTLAQNQMVDDVQNLVFRYFESYTNASDNQNNISNPENYNSSSSNQTIFVRISNSFGCFSIAELELSMSNNTLNNPSDIEECEVSNGIAVFDLTQNQSEITSQILPDMTLSYYESLENALTQNNPITNLTSYEAQDNTTIFVKISEDGNCFGIVWFELIVRFVDADLSDILVFICDEKPITITAPNGFSGYVWNNGLASQSIEITEQGNYTVTFSNEFGCEASKTYVVNPSSVATIVSIVIDDMNSGNNTVLITVEGSGDYEFSLNGIQYQESNFFANVPSGQHLVFVKDKNECGQVTQLIFVLEYPKFFTPNGDGINDKWRIPMLSNQYPTAQIEIFDRYGKLLHGFSAQDAGWDGIYNSEKLPATDYWFVVTLPQRTIRGHFSLLR